MRTYQARMAVRRVLGGVTVLHEGSLVALRFGLSPFEISSMSRRILLQKPHVLIFYLVSLNQPYACLLAFKEPSQQHYMAPGMSFNLFGSCILMGL